MTKFNCRLYGVLWSCLLTILGLGGQFSCASTGDGRPGVGDDGAAETDTVDDGGPSGTSEGHSAKEILPDCTGCLGVGTEMDHLRCAIDLCDESVFLSQDYSSPTVSVANKLKSSRAAVSHFGDVSNDLAPLYPESGGSYALMSTGRAVPSKPVKDFDHNQSLSSTSFNVEGPGFEDPFAPYEKKMYDVVEWRLELQAPNDAHGFRIHYVFFSVEYDEYVGRDFNDKFYVILESPSTNGGQKTVINFTDCRPNVASSDFVCPAGHSVCEEGEEFCYIAINSALSECCWYDGCTTAGGNTDINGTGFECGTEDVDYVGDYSMGFTYGSSTGWLATEWPVEPGERFAITFHLHDTYDSILDSEVLIDKFVFVEEARAGTVPVI